MKGRLMIEIRKLTKFKFSCIILVCLIIINFGCMRSSESKLAKWIIDHCPPDQTCKMTLEEVAPFEWDEVHFIREGASANDIREIIGFDYTHFEDIAERVIFVKADQVVYHEDRFPFPERQREYVLILPIDEGNLYKSFEVSTRFHVRTFKMNKINYVEISPVK